MTDAPKAKKADSRQRQAKRLEVVRFAMEHGLTITPIGYDYSIDDFLEFGHCVCKKDRPNCPCPESLVDIKEEGHCACRLLWKDLDTFRAKHLHDPERYEDAKNDIRA